MGKVKLIQVFGIHWSEVFYGFGGLYGIVVVVWHFCSIFDSFGPSKCRQAIWLIAGVIKSASVWSLQIISDPVGPVSTPHAPINPLSQSFQTRALHK